MQWYLPMTIIPGIGLIILSTSNLMLNLNSEISQLKHEGEHVKNIISLKLGQLKTLSWSIVFQYLGVILFLFSGLLMSMFAQAPLAKGLLVAGVSVVSISIFLLLIYSIKAVSIRQKHLEI